MKHNFFFATLNIVVNIQIIQAGLNFFWQIENKTFLKYFWAQSEYRNLRINYNRETHFNKYYNLRFFLDDRLKPVLYKSDFYCLIFHSKSFVSVFGPHSWIFRNAYNGNKF